jgi:hypothetical protein
MLPTYQNSESSGVRNSSSHLGIPNPHHPALDNRLADAQSSSEQRRYGHSSVRAEEEKKMWRTEMDNAGAL